MRFSESKYHGCAVEEDDMSDEYVEVSSDEEPLQGASSASMDESLDCLQFNGKKYEDLKASDMMGVEFRT